MIFESNDPSQADSVGLNQTNDLQHSFGQDINLGNSTSALQIVASLNVSPNGPNKLGFNSSGVSGWSSINPAGNVVASTYQCNQGLLVFNSTHFVIPQESWGGPYNSPISFFGNIFFRPGVWQIGISGGQSGVGFHFNGYFKIAGQLITNMTDVTNNPGQFVSPFSVFNGTSNVYFGVINIVIPAGGGFYELTGTMVIPNIGFSFVCTFLHA